MATSVLADCQTNVPPDVDDHTSRVISVCAFSGDEALSHVAFQTIRPHLASSNSAEQS